MVERWADLDDVAADHAETGQTAHERERFACGEPAGNRRAGAGRKCWIDGIDVEREVDRSPADPLAQLGAHALGLALADRIGGDDRVMRGARDRVVARSAARSANADLIELA